MSEIAFRVEPKPFATAVTWVAKHLPSKPASPMLAGVMLEVADGRLTVSSFDYDVAARAHADVVADTPGRAVVSGRLLAALVATFPDHPIDVTQIGAALEMVCGRIRVTLPTMPDIDYPTLPEMPATLGAVNAHTFADMVERVGLAADRDLSAAVKALLGIHLQFGPDEIRLMGSDRHRAAIGVVPWSGGDGQCALVPAPALIDAAKVFSAAETVTVGVDPTGLVGFASEHHSVVMRQLDIKEFPASMPNLFPARDDTAATVPAAELANALKRANLVRSAVGPALLTFTEAGLIVEAQGADAAKTAEAVDCTHVGPDLQLAVNPRYLAEALSVMRGHTVEVTITAPMKPILLTTPEDKGATYRHLIVPIRLT